MGALAADRNNPNQAKRLLDKAIQLQTKHGQNTNDLMRIKAELANWHFSQRGYNQALGIYREALPSLTKSTTEDGKLYYEALSNAIRAALHAGDTKQAAVWLTLVKTDLENDPTASAEWFAEVTKLEREIQSR